ncbi:hypothetical protein RHGRI_023879 [Rhododendron griersonianum]|uniref:RING-type domain-containing protein n=1 Tax=Rhododendron griersonianum TaxID=479676 RepID=A0AAV6J537_9ERIC|nr:hypothetical protein RHGRI_023879 [Rhododendron griersonianum]
MVWRKAMSWRRVAKSAQALAAHAFLFCFTLLLVFKLDHLVFCSWWVIFFPLWLFHGVVARGRFSLPAPSVPHGRHWAPCHAIVAAPLLIAFELLLCIYLESIAVSGSAAVNLKIVFLPLLAFEIIILIDNFRMCKALLPGDDESVSDEAIWETLPGKIQYTESFIPSLYKWKTVELGVQVYAGGLRQHFWVAISMVFFVAATLFTLLKLCGISLSFLILYFTLECGRISVVHLFLNFAFPYLNAEFDGQKGRSSPVSIAECFAFLVCTKWSNPVIHRNFRTREASSSSNAIRYLDWNSGLVVSSDDQSHDRICSLQDIGGHIMKVPIIGFQILLCMRLEGTPAGAKDIPLPVLFSPLFLLQGVGVLFALSRLVEKFVLLLRTGVDTGQYFLVSSKVRECFGYLHHGSRLLGWWSIDEGSREEQARFFHDGASGYNTFCGYPPEIVKKMPKKDLAEEVWRLQAALGEQTEITKFSQQEYERLQNEKVLCRVCFEAEIGVVLLPCRHRILCSACCDKCKKCPICRVLIEERLPVYDV